MVSVGISRINGMGLLSNFAQCRCIVVDSTRRGKSMPDALSKTIPIWVAVLNRLLFPEYQQSYELQSPLDVISESEHVQIQACLSGCARDVQSLGLDLVALREKLNGRPMQVTWQRPDDQLSEEPYKSDNLVVCCTASNQTSNTTAATSDYVQGAADDPEAWSLGLNAALFWQHQDELLGTNEDDLPALIERLVGELRETSSIRPPMLIRPTCNIWIGSNATASSYHQDFDMVLSCSATPNSSLSEAMEAKYVVMSCGAGKNGSRQLRTELSKVTRIQEMLRPDSKVLVTCETGRDLSVGTALAILCLRHQDDGALQHEPQPSINKTLIRQRLSWIMVSMPDASPSRATLQSVNSFLMG